jgi:AcrR family transcriptional regulator
VVTPVNPAYDPTRYPRRAQRARLTRKRVLDAALALFLERGYVTTTIEAIAERADVSPETIYATFRNKRSLLSELVDVTIAGNQDPTPILEQDWVGRMRDEPDVRRRLRLLATQGTAILARRWAVDEIVRGAATADQEIGALFARGRAQRYAGQRELLRIVVDDAKLRDGRTIDEAADVLYAIGSPDTYRSLVIDRGWNDARFEAWYAATLESLLLEPRATPPRRSR